MKYEYNQCELPCDPQSVRRDREVRNFVRVVKKFKLVTPLYVEVLSRMPQFNNVNQEKGFTTFNSDSGSNQMSSPSLSKQVGSRLVDEGNIYPVPIPETQVLETQFPFNVFETQEPETQFPSFQQHV